MESGYSQLSKNPRQTANIVSILFFGWSIPIFKKTYKNILRSNDAFEPLHEDRSERLGDRLERWKYKKKYFIWMNSADIEEKNVKFHLIISRAWLFQREQNTGQFLLRALYQTFWFEVLYQGMLYLFSNCFCRLTLVFLLKGFLSYFQWVSHGCVSVSKMKKKNKHKFSVCPFLGKILMYLEMMR